MSIKSILTSVICLLTICDFNSAQASTISVKTTSQFSQALKQAKGGDTISVAAGLNLGSVRISGSSYPSMVTITSASVNSRASFRDLSISNVKNLKISYMNFLSSSADALKISDSQNVTIDHNNFTKVYSGLTVRDSVHVLISYNTITSSFDAMTFNDVEDVMVQNNTATVTQLPGVNHTDLIQVVNEGATPTNNITFLNNTLRGIGNVHGIYMGNHIAQLHPTNKSYWYSDILIQGNTIVTDKSIYGIGVSHASDVQILNNNVSGGKATILVESANTGVTILKNKTSTKPRAGHVLGSSWSTSNPIPKSWNVDF